MGVLEVGMTKDDMVKLDLKVQMSLAVQNFDRLGVKPKSGCKHCHGRGSVGRDVTPGLGNGRFVVCDCLLKQKLEIEGFYLKNKAEREKAEKTEAVPLVVEGETAPEIEDAQIVTSKPSRPRRKKMEGV